MMQDKRTQTRMPAEVHQWLAERAKTNDRSMNAELVRILKEAMDGTAEQAAFERGRMAGIQQAMNP
jgi:plasmid stability protein